MKTNKIIGIPGYVYQNGSFGVGPNYLEFASKFGNPRILMPWEVLATDIDLLLCPGGPDLSPDMYGEFPGYRTSNNDVHKDFFYRERLKNYIEAEVPIFGICLGMQAVAVHFGLKLHQNLMWHAQSKDRWETAHELTNKEGKKVKWGAHTAKFNSHHHQCVLESEFDFEDCPLEPMYFSEFEDGPLYGTNTRIVEVFKHKSLPIICHQNHPEELYDPFAVRAMQNLLKHEKEPVNV